MSSRPRRWCCCGRRAPVANDAALGEYRPHLPPDLQLTEGLIKLIRHWQRQSSLIHPAPHPPSPSSLLTFSPLPPHCSALRRAHVLLGLLLQARQGVSCHPFPPTSSSSPPPVLTALPLSLLVCSENGAVDPLEFFAFLHEPRTRLLNYIIPIIGTPHAHHIP